MNMDEIITLNVGGQLFTTHRETLQGRYFECMFSGRLPPGHIINGGIFIDRSALLFEYIMQYLRSPNNWEPPSDLHLLKNISNEAQYYGIANLIELMETVIANLVKMVENVKAKKPIPKFESFTISLGDSQTIPYFHGVPQHIQTKLRRPGHLLSISEILHACRPWYRCVGIEDAGRHYRSLYFETDIHMIEYAQ